MLPRAAALYLIEFSARLIRPAFRRSPIDVTFTASRANQDGPRGIHNASVLIGMHSSRMNSRKERLNAISFTRNEGLEAHSSAGVQNRRSQDAGPGECQPQTRYRVPESALIPLLSDTHERTGPEDTPYSPHRGQGHQFNTEWQAHQHANNWQGLQYSNDWQSYQADHDCYQYNNERQVHHDSCKRSWRRGHRPDDVLMVPQQNQGQSSLHRPLRNERGAAFGHEEGPISHQSDSQRYKYDTDSTCGIERSNKFDGGESKPPSQAQESHLEPLIQTSFSRQPTYPWRPISIRAGPRDSYLKVTESAPSTFTATAGPPPTLPLLILDLNGTLVFRGRNKNSGAKNPTMRPYLSSFLQYCLGVKDPSFGYTEEADVHQSATDVDQKVAQSRQNQWMVHGSDLRGEVRGEAIGVHFHAQNPDTFPPSSDAPATQRLLVWSSAQVQNVNAMVQAILHPAQAAQLVRVWARHTLVPRRLFSRDSPSIKDLEIVWNALNHEAALERSQSSASALGQTLHEGERRVNADYRDQADFEEPDGALSHCESEYSTQKEGSDILGKGKDVPLSQDASLRAALTAARFVKMPKLSAFNEWLDGRGFGPHNTLLLDDSTEKARMQPYNHLLIPDFDAERAIATKIYRERLMALESGNMEMKGKQEESEHRSDDGKRLSPFSQRVEDVVLEDKSRRAQQRTRAAARAAMGEQQEAQDAATASSVTSSDPEPDIFLGPKPDTVLLQAVGVLEHARWQVNVASWIRHGGLGSFAGMTQPGVQTTEQGGMGVVRCGGKAREECKRKKGAGADDLPLLDAPPAEKTEAFWVAEGKRALLRRGVPIIF